MIRLRQSRSAISSRLRNLQYAHATQAKNKAKARTQTTTIATIISLPPKQRSNYDYKQQQRTMSRINGSGGSANAAYDEFAVAFGPPPAPPQPDAEEIPEGFARDASGRIVDISRLR